MPISSDDLIKIHYYLSEKSRSLISTKGKKYCGAEQDQGDTLASRVLPYKMGIGKHPGEYSLGRAIEKIYRLKSMMEQGEDDNKQGEGLQDSVWDVQNDVIYAYTLYMLDKGKTPEELIKHVSFVTDDVKKQFEDEKQARIDSDYTLEKMNLEDTSDERESYI